MADINQTCAAVEAFVRTYEARGSAARSVQVRPSGDDVEVIKIWLDVDQLPADRTAWAAALEAALGAAVPDATAFTLQIRVEST